MNKDSKDDQMIDLSQSAVILLPHANAACQEQKAAQVLVEEVFKRAKIRWTISNSLPGGETFSTRKDNPVAQIILGLRSVVQEYYPSEKWVSGKVQETEPLRTQVDGFQILTETTSETTRIFILGNDARGILFGVGYLLRTLSIFRKKVLLLEPLNLITAPKYALRGHQLGYRDKTNSYDGWDVPQWDQYIRDLAIFGTNAIELIPPRSDDRLDSVHFPLPPLDMMQAMSGIADDYGLDVWIWYPAMDDDYSRPDMVDFALNEWEQVYKSLPRIDALLVPGGDPGNTRPRWLMPMLEKQTRLLHKYHPQAQMWVSAQGFNQEWMEEFLSVLREETLPWLTGVVYGPWIHMTLAEFRQLIPQEYPIRHYPDITHSLDSQYPVPDWDIAYALTEGRETINPRPRQEAAIFRQMGKEVIGFLTYSEGCNDDVNKFIWSGLGWDPEQDVQTILRQYSRFFIGTQHAHDFAAGLLALESNWCGPLIANEGVSITLSQFQAIEKSASPELMKNWRFQQALYRAYYDGYTRSRLVYEKGLEEQAFGCLRQADQIGSLMSMSEAEKVLDRAVLNPINADWRLRIFRLAEALFQSVHMQLSVPLYAAQSETRGANLDGLDYPLNDRLWLKDQFATIRKQVDEEARLDLIRELTHWTDPGPGGYYLDLSNHFDCPNIVKGLPYDDDPAFYRTAHRRFPYWKNPRPVRRAWRGYTGGLNDFPLRLSFPNLDPHAHYKLRVVYSDTEEEIPIRLVANDSIEIHPFMLKPFPTKPLEFNIPVEATRDGVLGLSLWRPAGLGGLGAGQEISEIWIIKRPQ